MLVQPTVGSAAHILYRSDALVTAELNKVVIIFWRQKPTRDTFLIQKNALDTMVRRHGSGVGVICVVEPTSEPPEDELRKASSKMVIDHGERISCVGCVIEGSGFRAAITRTALSGITFMIRTPAPIKFFVTPQEAAAWIATRMTVEHPERFAENVERVREYFVTNK